MIRRYSSRREKLDTTFLNARLQNARDYDRIAGYFSSSLLDVAGEALESVAGRIRIVCNSELDVRDVETARAAQQSMRQEWCAFQPEQFADVAGDRFARLYKLLQSGKLAVKVLPTEKCGLVHGKAGVITLEDGHQTSFLGSTNATRNAWQNNYELLWEDDSPEGIAWVQEEFDALWESGYAVPLADFVIEDIGRIARRTVIGSVESWREKPEPASVAVEMPIFREELGLWEHQKYFVKRAFDAHQRKSGARLVLADMVGLGKTVQLALSGMLMALQGDGPILILVPNTLRWQWQGEMRDLLDMPSAVWDNDKKQWVDENGIEHPRGSYEGIAECPRRVGVVSQSLIVHQTDAIHHLKKLYYECIIVDETHKARRKNLRPGCASENPEPNNLLAFLYEMSPRTKSMLLATATPVQLYPVEAWDLLDIVSRGSDAVLGSKFSNWRRYVADALDIVMGHQELPEDDWELWAWVRNPLPPAAEDTAFELIRRSLDMGPDEFVAPGNVWPDLRPSDQSRVTRLRDTFGQYHNPFIRNIVRRTRDYLENTIDPATNEPYMDRIKVELHGERSDEAIRLPAYLEDAYRHAEEFSRLFSRREQAAGFMKMLLLRRMGSTIEAGHKTAERLLAEWQPVSEAVAASGHAVTKSLTPSEEECLRNLISALQANKERDPKYHKVVEYLLDRRWLERGCIIFSQYYESIWWLAQQLSSEDLPDEPIGIYAAREKSGILQTGAFTSKAREDLKTMVRRGDLRLLLGTESASEGLNLQKLSTLINLDLPWNPTRLEQRKGRIQRIGQVSDTIHIYNMRYKDSVEDRVHELLSERLEHIYSLFGQLPDTLEDAWIYVALDEIEEAQKTIDAVPEQHPFEIRYEQEIEPVGWESCAEVLAAEERRACLMRDW